MNSITRGASIGAVLGGMTKAEQARVPEFVYSTLGAHLVDLRSVVEAKIAEDKQEADTFWTNLARLVKHLGKYKQERDRFEEQAGKLVADVEDTLANIEKLCESQLKIHERVPEQLRNDAKKWKDHASQVRAKIFTARELQAKLPSWSGDVRNDYDATIGVQVAALSELEGVMKSTGTGCETGAILNQAIFFAVDKAVIKCASAIRPLSGGDGVYYVRCAGAYPELAALLTRIQAAIDGEVTAGTEEALSVELRNTVTMPHVLEPGRWPTGTGAAGIAPAATDSGVTNDGSDADLDVQGNPQFCIPGVDL